MTVEQFKKEVMPLKNKVYRFAARLLKSREEAEDAAQEVFLRLWRYRGRLAEYRSVEAFAMVITKNFCLDMLKSKRIRLKSDLHDGLPADGPDPYRDVQARDSFEKLKEAIEGLPVQQRMVIQLRDIEGYEFEEIADITGMKPNALRVSLSRARQKVRDTLTKDYNYEYGTN